MSYGSPSASTISRTWAGGTGQLAKLGKADGEAGIMVDPPDQLPVGGLGGQAGVVELCQLRTTVAADAEISLFFHVFLV